MRYCLLVLALGMMVGLSGCQTTNPTIIRSERLVAYDIPKQFLRCDGVTYPNPATLTDAQVAELLVKLDGANSKCRNNMEAIKAYIAKAKARINRRS
jgi:hypothetical protein